MRSHLHPLLVAAVVTRAALAQSPSPALPRLDDYHVRAFGIGVRGLLASDVRDIAQTPDGYLYVAQAHGLTRFNGYQFQHVELPGISGAFVEHLHLDRAGRLWILTRTNDLGYIEHRRFHALPHPPTTALSMWETHDGSVWLAGIGGLVRVTLNAVDPYTDLTSAPGIGRDRVYGVFDVDGAEQVVVTRQGVARVMEDSVTHRVSFARFGPPCVIAADVRADANGLWLPCDRGDHTYRVLRYHGGRFTPYNEPGRPGLTLDDFDLASGAATFHPDGLRWVVDVPRARAAPRDRRSLFKALLAGDGTRWLVMHDSIANRDGLVRLADSALVDIDVGDELEFRTINRIVEDHEGSLWLATDRGLLQLSRPRVHAVTRQHGLAESFTVPVLQTGDGAVWVGTWGGGLHRFAGGRLDRRYTTRDGLAENRVRSLYEDADGGLWVGTGAGFSVLRGGRIALTQRTRSEVRAFAAGEFSNGARRRRVEWIATRLQLFHREDDRLIEIHPGFFTLRDIWALHVDRRATLWVATEGGLFRRRGDLLSAVTAEEGLRGSVVAIHEDSSGALWFSTYEQGLYRYRDGRFAAITTRDGLPANGVWQMVEDGHGRVWMSSDAGLFSVDAAELNAIADAVEAGGPAHAHLRAVLYTEADGLPSRESNRASPGGWRLRNGNLVFNNMRGLLVVDASGAAEPAPAPRVLIERMAADGSALPIVEPPPVPTGTRQLVFEFAALSFLMPDQNRYRYRLDGYDDAWVEAGTERRASYIGLPPGHYRLLVQGATVASGWSDAAVQSFTVLPAWWQLRWLQLSSLVVVGIILGAVYRLRVRHLLEVERMRLRIAADLHDDVGSNLSSIALLSEMLQGRSRLEEAEQRQLHRISRAAEETILALRDIIWLVDPKHNDLAGLVDRMRHVSGQLLDGTSHTLRTLEPLRTRPLSMTFVRNTILIYKEALHNVMKHSSATRVAVEVGEAHGRFVLSIEDDGTGFDEANIRRGRGLDSMRRRAEQVGGTVEIGRAPGGGTRVTFSAKMA